jgi:hypothetical protein
MEPMSGPSDDAIEVGRRLCAALDPLMTARGFQSGQVGYSSSEVGVVYCSRHVDFRARFPNLAPAVDYSDDGACTDLNISVALSPRSHLSQVHLDGHDLDELLRDAGRSDLHADVASLAEVPMDVAAEHLHTVLTAVFADPSQRAAPQEEDSHV